VFDFYFVINFVCLVLQRYGGLLQFANFLTLFFNYFYIFIIVILKQLKEICFMIVVKFIVNICRAAAAKLFHYHRKN